MEKPIHEPETHQPTLSECSGGRTSNDSNSLEFEFWMVRNPSLPQPHLLSADELFVDGVILPLHLLPQHSDPPDSDHPKPTLETPDPEHGPRPESPTVSSTSKRWIKIFTMGEKKTTTATNNQEDKEKKKKKNRKERKSSTGASAVAELNINIWPFSRSRSAGSTGNQRKIVSGAATRKVSSAPCSRSNSAGESKSKKWPLSPGPGRGAVHLGRSSPVWQVRRGGSCVRSSEPVVRDAEKDKIRFLNLNVPTCIGYGDHLSCRSNESSNVAVGVGGGAAAAAAAAAGNGGSGGHHFHLRTLFSKKVY